MLIKTQRSSCSSPPTQQPLVGIACHTTQHPLVSLLSNALLLYANSVAVGALTSGVLFARIRKTGWQFFTVTIIQTVFIAAMASVDQHTPRRAIGFVIVAAFGVGASQIIGLLIIQFGAADDRIGVATGYVAPSLPHPCMIKRLTSANHTFSFLG